MTGRSSASLILLLLCHATGIAYDKQPKKDGIAADEKPEQVAKRKANEVAQATVKSDFQKVADLTYPQVIEEMGGRKKMIETMKIGLKEMELKGIKFLSAKVENASPAVADGSNLYTIVPMKLELKVPGGRFALKSYLLGISPDKGETWTFVDGSGIGSDRIKAQRILPNLPAKLHLPLKEKTVFHKDE